MTNVYIEQNGNRYKLVCKGHAGSVQGCAAVSTLCCTLAGYLDNIGCEFTAELESGNAIITFSGTSDSVKAAFDFACVGFLQLAASYPEDVDTYCREIV